MTVWVNKLVLNFFLVLCLFSNNIFSQEVFLRFSEHDGLPRNSITCLQEDQYGYLWIGTGDGIARYDGNDFYCYDELSGSKINSIIIDSTNSIWITNGIGLYCLNRITNSFELKVSGYIPKIQFYNGKIYYVQYGVVYSYANNSATKLFQVHNIYDFYITAEGIWIGATNGVSLFSEKTSDWQLSMTIPFQNQNNTLVTKIDSVLFLSSNNGNLYYKLPSGSIKNVVLQNHYPIWNIRKVGLEYWLATDGNGIIVLDKQLNVLRSLKCNPNSNNTLCSNSIYDIYQGLDQKIWVATYDAGLNCIMPDNLLFKNILPEKGNPNSLIGNYGTSVFTNGPLFYFGTNYGLSVWNANTNVFHNLSADQLKYNLNGNKVTALCVDQNSNLWLGTYDGLLGKYNKQFELIKTFHPCSKDNNEMQQILMMVNAENSHLLLLTAYLNHSLVDFDINKEDSDVFELYKKGSHNTTFLINSIRKNQKGELLALISDIGLFKININDNILEDFLPSLNKNYKFYGFDFYNDYNGNYWITTSEGLRCISEDGKNVHKWTKEDGLPSNFLMRIESIDGRFLWISSLKGLCRFDIKTGKILNFNFNDGLPANEFLNWGSATTSDRKIIFSSVAGFTLVDPLKVPENTKKDKILISDITFHNKSIHSIKKFQLKIPLEDTKEITLPYNLNSFAIHFFTKNYNLNKYQNYAYRLIGLEKNWINLGKIRYTTYTNLSPGTYSFEVKLADNNQQEADQTKLTIHILPPWYLSWYAYVIYFILIFTIFFLSIYAYLERLKVKKEKEMAEFKIQKEHELTEKKLEFFSNISHDLRTPLTLIDAPVNDLLQSKNLDKDQAYKLDLIRSNSTRLVKLINDLLDFRKITQSEHSLKVEETDICKFLEDIYYSFISVCKNKTIRFEKSIPEELTGYVDPNKLEKILLNLLSNALKFTNIGGVIILVASEKWENNQKCLCITLQDNGIGIEEKNLKRIFERFYKVYHPNTDRTEGYGIGLSIVNDLVKMHHGSISVLSKIGEGTTFTIRIPIDKSEYSDEEVNLSGNFTYGTLTIKNEQEPDYEVADQISKTVKYNLPILLIVEDEQELREYLIRHFEKSYKIYSAFDGLEALNYARDLPIDIILTDVKMPNMDGYQFCREIRQNFTTSHLPVIMLTSSNTIDQQIEGISVGADAYILKPFNVKYLDAVLNSILNNRFNLRKKILGVEPLENIEKSLPKKDIDFILGLKQYIEENMADMDLNIDLISKQFSVSPATLNRKIRVLTGLSSNNLIKSIRLKKAYKLIREDGFRASEAAYQTGFSDPNYFTICFKKEFGFNPSRIK